MGLQLRHSNQGTLSFLSFMLLFSNKIVLLGHRTVSYHMIALSVSHLNRMGTPYHAIAFGPGLVRKCAHVI